MIDNIVWKNIISKAEDIAEKVHSKTRSYLPTASRLCLLSVFIDDAIRTSATWSENVEHLEEYWSLGRFLSNTLMFIVVAGEIGGTLMIALQKTVSTACSILCGLILFQSVLYNILWIFQVKELFRNLALIGALLILLAENQGKAHTLFAGVPTLDGNNHKNYLQLSGRCFLLFMFLTIVKFEASFLQILKNIVGAALMFLVIVGYKTKLSAFTLIVFLTIFNFQRNSWWVAQERFQDIKRYLFFHTLAVIGGLFMIVLHGPGGISFDENKKKW